MTSKILATQQLSAPATITRIYTVPVDTITTSFISVINQTSKTIKFSIAIGMQSEPNKKDYVKYDSELLAHATLSEYGMVISPQESIWVSSDSKEVTVRIEGIETPVGRISLD